MNDLHDIADLVEVSSNGSNTLRIILFSLFIAALIGGILFYYLLRQRRKRLVIQSSSWSKKKILEELEKDVLPLAQRSESRSFLFAIENVLRRCIENCCSIPCREKTMGELLNRIKQEDEEDDSVTRRWADLVEWLTRYEGVKFSNEELSKAECETIYKEIKSAIQLQGES